MAKDASIIYVAGNPDLYPIEYYDPESHSFEGAIPEFLNDFADEYGYDLSYLKPGNRDKREQFAENQQVDIISGCLEGETYTNTSDDRLTLFSMENGEDSEEYSLIFTQVAPERLRENLREYASEYSQEECSCAIK